MFTIPVFTWHYNLAIWEVTNGNIGKGVPDSGNFEQQVNGIAGQIAIVNELGLPYINTNKSDPGYDAIIRGCLVDVKCVGRTVDPKDHYGCNFIARQKNMPAQAYLYGSLNSTTNTLTICGMISKKNLVQEKYHIPVGTKITRDNGTILVTEKDMYSPPISDLSQVFNWDDVKNFCYELHNETIRSIQISRMEFAQ